VTDRRTDGQTDGQTELRWLRRAESLAAFARKNATSVLEEPIRYRLQALIWRQVSLPTPAFRPTSWFIKTIPQRFANSL